MNPMTRLTEGLRQLGLDAGAAPALLHYLQQLERWNAVYNLTAVRDINEMVTRHVLDSLAVQPYLHGQRILDAGSGAGLPGIPLALINPQRQFCLLDSNAKKTRFLTQMKIELALENISIASCRIEQHRPNERYGTVISRAFASLSEFAESARPLCAPNGRLLAMKGAYPKQELELLPEAFKVINIHQLDIPGLDAERHLVHVEP